MKDLNLQEMTQEELVNVEGGSVAVFIAGIAAGYALCYIADNYF